MKTLYITRHAKSSWSDSTLSDFERPLNKRGKRDAPFMGKLLKVQNMVPEIIISSSANRALTTAKLLAIEMEYSEADILVNEELYESGMHDYIEAISEIDDQITSAMIVGHNPTLTNLAEYLSDLSIDNLPTCGIVTIEFDNDSWRDIKKRNGLCKSVEFPKKYFP